MYTVDIYTNTNLNPVNLPYSPSVVEASASNHYTLQSIDVVQNYFLNSVTVSGASIEGSFWDVIKQADYCKINNFYYFVTSVSMTSPDVAVLGLVPDFFTSARALGAIHSLGGTTVRYRVPEDEDVFGAFTNDDPLLTPSEPLELVTNDMVFSYDNTLTSDIYVETTIDIGLLTSAFTADSSTTSGWRFKGSGFGLTVTDPTDPDNKVTFPFVPANKTATIYKVGADITLPTRGGAIYLYDKVLPSLGLLQSLGVLGGVIKIFKMPRQYVNIDTLPQDDGLISSLHGTVQTSSSMLPFEYAKVKNKRVLYGSYNTYGLLSTSGAKFEANPELIFNNDEITPNIKMIVDPRPDGAPYFRYKYYNKDSSDKGFWMNAIKGSTWSNVPIYVSGESGSFLNYAQLGVTRAQKSYTFNSGMIDSEVSRMNKGASDSINQITNVMSTLGGSYTPYQMGMAGGLDLDVAKYNTSSVTGSTIAGGLSGQASNILETGQYLYNAQRRIQDYTFYKNAELANFGLNHSVSTPTIQFVPENNIIEDMYGNGVVPYRYHYSKNDLKRIDTLLTMYGYAVTKLFTADMLNKHDDFEYLELSGVQIYGDNLPMWWRQGITDQLNTGFRIWHVKPDVKYFDSGLSYEITDKGNNNSSQ